MDTTNCKNDIVNRALSLLRENHIFDFNNDPEEDTDKLVLKWWNTCLCEAIAEINPPFSIKRINLKSDGKVDGQTLEIIDEEETIDIDKTIINDKSKYLWRYRIPSDCLKILNSDIDKRLIEGNYIYNSKENNLLLKYQSAQTELYQREIKFNIALSYILAYYLCADLTNNDQKINLFLNLKDLKVSEARTYYLRETGIRIIKDYEWKK